MSEHVTSDEPYLLVEEVAERLGLPLSVLLHRVEAGDIPARRVERDDGFHYALRLGDLGIELDDRGMHSAVIDEETTVSAVFDRSAPAGVESAIASAFNSDPDLLDVERPAGPEAAGRMEEAESALASGPGLLDAERPAVPDVAVRAEQEEEEAEGGQEEEEAAGEPQDTVDAQTEGEEDWAMDDSQRPWHATQPERPAWSVRPREPQEPPVWLTRDPETEDVDEYVRPVEPEAAEGDDGMPAIVPSSLDTEREDEADADEDTIVAEMAVPPPAHDPQVGILDATAPGPRGDLASMSLDARELVAGLLDRWERTLEQRIYTEQRQRFQAELVARQNMVKQLQMELHTARAEHAAAQAEKDRLLAGKERELADRERDLAETRRLAREAEQLVAPATRRRRWFWNRDD